MTTLERLCLKVSNHVTSRSINSLTLHAHQQVCAEEIPYINVLSALNAWRLTIFIQQNGAHVILVKPGKDV